MKPYLVHDAPRQWGRGRKYSFALKQNLMAAFNKNYIVVSCTFPTFASANTGPITGVNQITGGGGAVK